jgi:hypothetical protein
MSVTEHANDYDDFGDPFDSDYIVRSSSVNRFIHRGFGEGQNAEYLQIAGKEFLPNFSDDELAPAPPGYGQNQQGVSMPDFSDNEEEQIQSIDPSLLTASVTSNNDYHHNFTETPSNFGAGGHGSFDHGYGQKPPGSVLPDFSSFDHCLKNRLGHIFAYM